MTIHIETSWNEQLKDEFEKKYFKDLMVFLENEYLENEDKIFPNKNLIFQSFANCPFEKVKVVILGQDPYPTKGHANGLCFSVESNVRPLPKSLLNIFKEIKSDLNIEIPENGNLLRWAEQGVLLLNSVLTVKEGEANSHSKKGWEQFTDAVISKLSKKEGLVYLLWGSKAQEKAKNVDEDLNCVLNCVHPSPLSSYRGFFGCKHFSKTNTYLEKIGKEKIDW